MKNDFKAIEKKNVVDDVFEQIQNKIVSEVWQPGQKIPSDNELCSMFNVSRVSVRSAVQKLRDLGLITTRHGKGSFVSERAMSFDIQMTAPIMNLSEKEFLDIMEFRELIETKCIELAVLRADEQDIATIEKALTEMKANQHDYSKYSLADYQFHFAIVKASKNQIFIHIIDRIKNVYYYHLKELNRVLADMEDSLFGHSQQLEAIKSRDMEAVRRLVREGAINVTSQTIKRLHDQTEKK
ncbi:FadR/GntR family transcriptional regulator [Cohnella cholangitidis]|uniref:FadR family transcriptional regulator n=1 Tax=Cohnella cholangitidis TaxID=2598458 RepID=A0A7G5C024_9BACL|nr:FadR/GntR family transcriptional regulator [Cohnella cholangitidis]QMV42558.1 FadR family transcriptional regulator [Cohnella cholangitidis]